MNKNKSQLFKKGSNANVGEKRKGLSKQKSDFAKTNNFQCKIRSKMASISEIPDLGPEAEDIAKNFVDYQKPEFKERNQKNTFLTIGPKQPENFISNEAKTTQIKVIARFRPTNKFEEVNFSEF